MGSHGRGDGREQPDVQREARAGSHQHAADDRTHECTEPATKTTTAGAGSAMRASETTARPNVVVATHRPPKRSDGADPASPPTRAGRRRSASGAPGLDVLVAAAALAAELAGPRRRCCATCAGRTARPDHHRAAHLPGAVYVDLDAG